MKLASLRVGQKGVAPLLVILLLVVLAGGAIVGYQMYGPKNQSTENVSAPARKVTKSPGLKKVGIPRSKAPGVILAAITAHGYNPKTGSAIKPDKYFIPKDPKLYLLMDLNKPKKGTKIEYVRYLQGRYLDHRSLTIDQANWPYAYFAWSARSGKEHKKGIYRVRVYSNGVLEKKVNYAVRS